MKTFKDTKHGDLTWQKFKGCLSMVDWGIYGLDGCPKEVVGHFDAGYNKLINLKHAPKVIHDDAFFSNNKLINLEGSLEKVHGDLILSYNPLESFGGNLNPIYVALDLCIFGLPFFKSLEQIKEAIEDADIYVGGRIRTDFGSFRQ